MNLTTALRTRTMLQQLGQLHRSSKAMYFSEVQARDDGVGRGGSHGN